MDSCKEELKKMVDNYKVPRRMIPQEQIDNNFKYHPPKEGQPQDYQDIRDTAKVLAELINQVCPDSREKLLAMTNLEQAVMWANASIARNG